MQWESRVLGDMSSLLSILLHELHTYGYPILWLIIFMAAVGLPLPASLVLLAAGMVIQNQHGHPEDYFFWCPLALGAVYLYVWHARTRPKVQPAWGE